MISKSDFDINMKPIETCSTVNNFFYRAGAVMRALILIVGRKLINPALKIPRMEFFRKLFEAVPK
jgi:hypothetical protein